MLNSRRNPTQGKKIKEKHPQNPQEKQLSPRAKHKKSSTGKQKGNPVTTKSLDKKEGRQAYSPCLESWLKVPLQQNPRRLPAPRSRWYSHIIPEQQHSPVQSGGSTQKPSASQTLLQFSIAIAQDEWLRKWISRENKTCLSPRQRHRQAGQQPSVCWALVATWMHLLFPLNPKCSLLFLCLEFV